jgi:hypothetical protein
MPLKRGSIIGYDAERMIFEFTMVKPDARVVTCHISSVAMDYLDGRRGTGTVPSEREAQFIRLRDSIEKIASDRFRAENAVQGAIVRIFEKHLPEGRARRVRD